MLEGHVAGESVLLIRHAGRVFAVGARCTHYGAALVDGLVVGGTVRCPWHHAAFDLETGEVNRPPALEPLPCWRVEERSGRVVVLERAARMARPRARKRGNGPQSVAILGGGAAGLAAALALRNDGYDGAITMVEAGGHAPYDRPNLSKDYLAGTAPEEWLPLRPDSFYEDAGVSLRRNANVVAIDVARRRLSLDDGASLAFDALLIATGAEPVRLDPAVAIGHVHYLRSLDDSRSIIRAAEASRRAVVLGASFIGLEVAASLRARGLEVTVVAPDSEPLVRVFGAEVGAAIRQLHESHGVAFRLGRTARRIDSDRVLLDDGESLPADLVVAGIGVQPRIELARAAGIAIDRGIAVNEYLETSVPGIYAAGDVARWPDVRTGSSIRVEHWVVAERQGRAAARNILAGTVGNRVGFDAVPFFWSAHYDTTIAYTGHADRWDAIEISGNLHDHDCTVSYRSGGRTLAVATMGRDRASLEAELALERETEPSDHTAA